MEKTERLPSDETPISSLTDAEVLARLSDLVGQLSDERKEALDDHIKSKSEREDV
jgi:hypothetical protein